MKKISIIAFLILVLSPAFSQEFRTGSTELDASLKIINTNGKSDFGAFSTQLKMEYKVTDAKIDYMSTKLMMCPADIYFALEIGKYSKRPIDEVLVIYQKHKGHGWGEIAKQAGIKPGSAEFNNMKMNAGGKAKKGKGHNDSKGNNKGKENKEHKGNKKH